MPKDAQDRSPDLRRTCARRLRFSNREKGEVMSLVVVAPDGAWSLGVLIGVPILGVIVLACLAWAVFWSITGFRERDGEAFGFASFGFASFGLGGLVLVLGIALSPLGYYPYDASYHQWRPVSGVVKDASSRFLPSSDGKATEQKIVVQYVGSELAFGCQDTRCALVKPGDTLDLKCKRAWQYQSESGYDCRFVGRVAAR